MPQEIVHLQVGGCGNNIGTSFWDQLHREHRVSPDGQYEPYPHERIATYYNQTAKGIYQPRSVLVDLDPMPMDYAVASKYGKLFKMQNCVYSGSSAGGNWAKGFFTEGFQVIQEIMDAIRRQLQLCDHAQGFQMFHSIGGGTGSGLGTLIANSISQNYPDKIMIPISVFPSPNTSDSVTEPYNAGLTINHLNRINNSPALILDNEAVYDICEKQLKLKTVTYGDINYLINQAISDFTSTQRYSCTELNTSLRKISTSLLIYNRLRFLTVAASPYYKRGATEFQKGGALPMMRDIIYGQNRNLSGCKYMQGRFLTCYAIFRGFFPTKQCEQATLEVQNRGSSPFVEWIPNNISYTLVNDRKRNLMGKPQKSSVCLQSSTAQLQTFQKICDKYEAMYRRRSFVHWYQNEGLDEGQMRQAINEMKDIITQYTQYQDMVAEEEYWEEQW